MAQQDEPLYDFPEPAQPSRHKLLCPQRGRGSLRSISVLDRLLLTVPVWLQLSVNPATALHILQREPPGTFLVRRSRTSQKNVLCVRLADDSVPSFVQQFGIREEQSTLSLETSAIIFPDLPRLISFYCVSRDVLPFPLELPEAIAKATSHKELESISHMGIEFWSSHLNVRGPREAPKPRKDEEKQPDAVTSASPATQPDSAPHPDPDDQPATAASDSDNNDTKSDSNPTLFHKFCPITTRSPRELDCGSGQGALCFINPLFLQSQSTLSRRRMFKHSLKVRVSMESSTMLSPPLAPPPPPPLMPKAKGRCKVQKVKQRAEQPSETPPQAVQANQAADGSQDNPSGTNFFSETPEEDQIETEPGECKVEEDASAQLPAVLEPLCDDYMKPCPAINCISLSPYQSPSVAPMAPSLFPKVYPSCSPHNSPSLSPSLSPYHSPSPSPKALLSLSPNVSPSISPSISPYTSPSSSPLTEQVGGTRPNASGGEESEEVHTEENHHNGEEKIDFFKKEECFSAESPQESETYSSNRPAEKTETETLSPNEQTSQTSSQQT